MKPVPYDWTASASACCPSAVSGRVPSAANAVTASSAWPVSVGGTPAFSSRCTTPPVVIELTTTVDTASPAA